MKRLNFLIVILLMPLLLVSCSPKNSYKYVKGKVNVVATTTMIGDLVNEIGGDYISLTTLMATGVDPHSYVARPSVTTAVNEADLVVTNGLHLEAKMGKVLEVLKDKHLALGNFIDETNLIKDEHGAIDPHIWFNVENWIIVAYALTDKLITLDFDNKDSYLNNLNNYLTKLEELDLYIKQKVQQLNLDKRILITAHDAFSYFGKAYGFTVYSIQGVSTQTEASVKDIQNLANLIVKTNVKAIFLESSIPDSTIKSVIDAASIKGHKVVIGGTIYSDSLGGKNSNAETYIKMFKHNIDVIVESLK